MRNVEKYTRQYFMPPGECMKWTTQEHIEKAPRGWSGELRAGKQALIVPMTMEQKRDVCNLRVMVGVK